MSIADDATTLPVIVLLAAGEGRRYGGVKQLAEIGGQPMVRRAARTALDSGMPVVVVTGAHSGPVGAVLRDLPLQVVRNAAWQEGMGSSLAAGIRHLRASFPRASGALVCLADQPLVDAGLLRRMLDRHRAAPDRLLASGRPDATGPPVLFPGDCLAALAGWSGTRGARSLLAQHAARVEWFESPSGIDVDTPADLQRACDWLAGNRTR